MYLLLFFYSTKNIIDYIMGCSACITTNITIPEHPSHKALKNLLTKLIPSTLITAKQFRLYIAALMISAKSIIGIQRWQLLIFCRGLDLFSEYNFSEIIKLKHPCFTQIDKDIYRTYPQIEQNSIYSIPFQKALKNLALYFPSLGYTQGINFIVGFLLIEGLSNQKAFWMTVYLFLHPDFLMMGLYEEGFPLTTLYCRMFNYLLQKQCPQIYQKFTQINLAPEAWIFKWFATYYLYSFDRQIIRKIWDFIMIVGGIGTVYFAVALVKGLSQQFLELNSDFQVNNFLNELKNKEVLNLLISPQQLILISYTIKLTDVEISKIAQEMREDRRFSDNFYIQYYANFEDKIKIKEIHTKWLTKLNFVRSKFHQGSIPQKRIQNFNRSTIQKTSKTTKMRIKPFKIKLIPRKKQEINRIYSDTFSNSSSIFTNTFKSDRGDTIKKDNSTKTLRKFKKRIKSTFKTQIGTSKFGSKIMHLKNGSLNRVTVCVSEDNRIKDNDVLEIDTLNLVR